MEERSGKRWAAGQWRREEVGKGREKGRGEQGGEGG